MGAGPSRANTGEGTSSQVSINVDKEEKEKEDKKDEEEEEKEDGDKDENQDGSVKDEDDDKDQGVAGMGGSNSSDTDDGDGDNEEVFADQPSTNQGSKPTYSTVEGQVLDNLYEEYKVDDSVDVYSLIQKSDNENTPPTDTSSTKIDKTGGLKLQSLNNPSSFKTLLYRSMKKL
ncbi:hypothetical protein L1987_09618 [Smallanthus sonchifolius]|uniref:Uncharacterized protein n=1 Tax=Smallanthus sonchifolius TaxID=185202 RepID=A0ACB9JPW0_9ASTR|nr:hypothetical protein L1987_09618 [Smallanthus sonchifolius]